MSLPHAVGYDGSREPVGDGEALVCLARLLHAIGPVLHRLLRPLVRETIGHLCKTWRNRLDLQEAYAAKAEDLELAVAQLELTAGSFREVQTFAAIERLLIRYAAEQLLSCDAELSAGLAIVRRGSFWSRRAPELLLQWSLVEVAASLLRRAVAIRDELKKRKWTLDELIAAYSHHADPWMRLDREARHLESRYARFDFDAGTAGADWEKVMAKCRTEYLITLDRMAELWTRALEAADFTSKTCPEQSDTFKEQVVPLLQKGSRIAYFLVDALRFEMAAELLEGLSSDFELRLRPALGQLPSITPVGMAALMPGAEQGGWRSKGKAASCTFVSPTSESRIAPRTCRSCKTSGPETLRELRRHSFTEVCDRHFSFGPHLNARDVKAVRKTVSGLIKLVYPHGEFTKEELAELLDVAMEGRRRVKEQLKKMGSFEYHQTSFSYRDHETTEERFAGVPEEGGRSLIATDPLAPGSVYAASVNSEGKVGLYRIEVGTSAGTGKLKLAGGVDSSMKNTSRALSDFFKA